MTPEAQRIAIAEACGLKKTTRCAECFGSGYTGSEQDHYPCDECKTTGRVKAYYENCPNYLSDLNAMYSAEESLTDEEMHDMNESMYLDTSIKRVWRATASERAKHFLKVKGLWKE